jgi:hypothetical protein
MQLMKYGPKGALSPTLGDRCPLCNVPFAVGDFTALVRTAGLGKYSNDSAEAHWECAARSLARGTGH